jgi:tRNA threonylcarbamoyladenosine biosynthesis protein TsaB
MKILALELSSSRGSIAWLADERMTVRDWPNDRKDSGPFFQNLLAVRTQFGLPDVIIVGIGPGSYAGIRIAISAAIGLQALSDRRLLGYPSICAIETEAEQYCVIGNARRRSFFFARIDRRSLTEGPILLSEAELRVKIGLLDRGMAVLTTEHLPQFERAIVRQPSASVLAGLVHKADAIFLEPPLEPIYLRDPYVTMKRPIGQPSNAI